MKYLEKLLGIKERTIKVKKENVFQQSYSILLQSQLINIKLMKAKFWNRSHMKYALFKKTNLEIRLGTLHLNNLRNIETRYEILEDLNIKNKFLIKRKENNIKDYLLTV